MLKALLLVSGGVLTVLGLVTSVMPIPVPFIGVLPLMAGLALLINNSRMARRAVQRIRHRVRWISYMIEHMTKRGPKPLARVLRRSHPGAIARRERIRTRPQGED